MPLDAYQKNILSDFRKSEREQGIQFLTLSTGAGYSAYDAYKKQTYVETPSYFSGSLLWNPLQGKQDSAGGFYNASDIIVLVSNTAKTTAQSKDVKVVYENIKFRISRVIECPETEELVIYASRLE